MKNNSYKEEIILQAIKLHFQGNIREATKYYKYCISQDINDPRIFSNYGAILQSLGKLEEAAECYRKAIKLNPEFVNAHSNLGNILRDLGKLREAELSTRRAIKFNPDFAMAHSNLGNILRDLGNFKEAELSYLKAIEINPNFADAHSNLGVILRDLGKLEKAELSALKAIEINPNFADAYSNLGVILGDLGKLKEAKLYTLKAIKLNPKFADAHYNLGNILKELGNFKEAELSTRRAIELDPKMAVAHSNLGNILRYLGKLREAELSTRRAIEINPNFADAHSNLGNILRDLGNFKEAELSILKAIELDPDHSKAFFALSTFKLTNIKKKLRDKLCSENFLNNKSKKDKVDIYFAKANIFHKESNFKESSKYLQLANNLKQKLNPSNMEYLLKKSKNLILESNKELKVRSENTQFTKSIFIVGMPRSGSTLLESILSINKNVDDLGETNILEESFLSWKNPRQKLGLEELYLKKTNPNNNKLRTTTNKWLYNYQYVGIICTQIPNAKIIHSFRNPLDNILSIYRANFAMGNQYSSSLVDCANVYLDQKKVMNEYKKKFRDNIYDLNYDSLVSNPNKEIKSLISWLDWEWNDKYLSPHLNPRSVSTASNIQVRFPINSKSINGWMNYREMLKPAIEIINRNIKI